MNDAVNHAGIIIRDVYFSVDAFSHVDRSADDVIIDLKAGSEFAFHYAAVFLEMQ